jgi:hypothetical protein
MFIPAITNKLLQQLNSNAQTITFRGGSLLQVANDKFEFTTFVNYYTAEKTEFIPVMFDYVSSPKNIPNKELYDWTIDITFALTGENEAELADQREAIDTFRAGLVNTPLGTLTIGSTTYNYVSSATDISLVRDVVIVNSKKRVLVSMQVFLQSGLDAIFGNNRVVELKLNQEGATYSQIFPFEFNITMAKDVDAEMEFSKENIQSLPRNRSTIFNLKMFHEDTALIRVILQDIFGSSSALTGDIPNQVVTQTEVSLNRSYVLRYKLPNNNQQFIEYKVLLESGTINSSFGSQNLLDLNFKVLYE